MGNLQDFLSTSCITNLSFLANIEEGEPDNLNPLVRLFLEHELSKPFFMPKVIQNSYHGDSKESYPLTMSLVESQALRIGQTKDQHSVEKIGHRWNHQANQIDSGRSVRSR